MADTGIPTDRPGGSAPSGGALSGRMLGLPTWAWLGIAAAGGIVFFVWRGKNQQQQQQNQAPIQVVPDNSTGEWESVAAMLRDIQGAVSVPEVEPPEPAEPKEPPNHPPPPLPKPQPGPNPHPAPPPPPKQRTFTVTKWPAPGSSLWSIAGIVYGNPSKWPAIYNANRNKISNPNLIYPGQVLVIP